VQTTLTEATACLAIPKGQFDKPKQERARRCMMLIGWDLVRNPDGKFKMLHGAPIWRPIKEGWDRDDDDAEAPF
jgi:hypothetical protein